MFFSFTRTLDEKEFRKKTNSEIAKFQEKVDDFSKTAKTNEYIYKQIYQKEEERIHNIRLGESDAKLQMEVERLSEQIK